MSQELTAMLLKVVFVTFVALMDLTLIVGIAYVKKKIGVESMNKLNAELMNKQVIVDAVVLLVQQVYEKYSGEQKYAIALETASTWMMEKGLSVTADELRSMIEASVKALKAEFGKAWSEAIDYDFEE